jgi:hypothetical protein
MLCQRGYVATESFEVKPRAGIPGARLIGGGVVIRSEKRMMKLRQHKGVFISQEEERMYYRFP